MKRILSLILSLIATAGLSLHLEEDGYVFFDSRSFLWLPILFLTAYGLHYIFHDTEKRLKRLVIVPSVIIAGCDLFGAILVKKGTALWIFSDSSFFHKALYFLGHLIVYYCLIFFFYRFLSEKLSGKKYLSGRIPFLILWCMLILCWLPWFLNQFPAIMTADTTDQIEMALGVEPMSNHHPVFYTLILRLFLKIGQFLTPDNPNQNGIILFSILQFSLMSALAAGVLRVIMETEAHWLIKTGALLFFLLYPVHPIYSVTIWKDVPFALSLLWMETMLILEQRRHKRWYCIGIAAAGLLLTLFRHNGIYILLLSIPFLLIAYKTERRHVLFALLSSVLLFFVWNNLLIPAFHIPSGEASEALSIPLQQIALTAKRQKQNLSEQQTEEIRSWFNDSDIGEFYFYRISDPVKNRFNEEKYRSDPSSFWKFWLSLGKTYPQDYLDGLLLHTYGYWYPETPHWVFITGIDDDGVFGIHMDPKLNTGWAGEIIRWLSDQKYDNLPLLSLLFSPGACFWSCLILFFYGIYRKSPAVFFFMPLFILWLTALASPVNCEYRYVYGMFLCFPLIAAVNISSRSNTAAAEI